MALDEGTRPDYIIVGAGSAGSVLADRLSANAAARVLVLEAGGSDRHPWIKMPIGYGKTFHNPRVNWRFRAEPDAALEGRQMYWPRGRVLGGSSSINGLVYSRGLPSDFDDWAAAGNPGWDWSAVAPIFDSVERRVASDGTESGQGPLTVADRSTEYHTLGRHFLSAASEAGLPSADPDAAIWSEGVAPYRLTTRGGLRCSAADAFLRPAMRRPGVRVMTGAEVLRVLVREGRAVGVRIRHDGRDRDVFCKGEVVLAAGAVKSPQLLQLSGIGPGALLQEHGIETVIDNCAVGGGLQDHVGIDYLFRATEPTLNQTLGTVPGQVRAALEFFLRRRGALSLSVNQMGGMVRTGGERSRADVQLYFNPLSYTRVERNRRSLLRPDPWPGFAFGFNACRPTSRGRIDLAGPEPTQAPAIRPNTLATNQDIADVLNGARLIERMLGTDALTALIERPNGFTPSGATDDAIIEDFRARASTVFHPCGTCRMAPREDAGVVDPALRVYGVEGLRVVDASVFPNITSANTNAPTLMVAARAAALMRAG